MNSKVMFGWMAALLASATLARSQTPLAAPTPVTTALIWNAGHAEAQAGDGRCNRVWFTAESLLWVPKNQPLPVPILSTGNLGLPTSVVLLGVATPFNSHALHGGRFTAGTYLGCDDRFGIEGSYFHLLERTDRQTYNSNGAGGSLPVGFPFLNVGPTGATTEAFTTLGLANTIRNTTTLEMSTQLQGAELNGLMKLASGCNFRIDLIAGGRYLDLNEELSLSTFSPTIPPTAMNNFTINDQFETRNQFYGGQVGARFEVTAGQFFVNGTGKIAAGQINQEVQISGSFRQDLAAATNFGPGGFFALPSNSGTRSRNQFAYMPEGTVNVGFKVTEHIRASAGYNFLWVSNVLRPGDQIDRALNTSQSIPGVFGGPGTLTGPARPSVPFNETTFWAQGISLGLEIRY